MNIIVFGASGMLGHTVADYLHQHRQEYNRLTFTVRADKREKFQDRWPEAVVVAFNVERDLPFTFLQNNDYAINCIGVINKLIDENDGYSLLRAQAINTVFPEHLATDAIETKTKIMHPSTDCVFSGLYCPNDLKINEELKPDARDCYGQSKLQGEIKNDNVYVVRCSIVGLELDKQTGLLEWFLSQHPEETIDGWQDHFWNGITTLAYAKLFHVFATQNIDLPHLLHFIPADYLHKATLLDIFAEVYDRKDIQINHVNSPSVCFKNLDTIHKELNGELWKKMGYESTPTIKELIKEMKEWQDKRF